LEGVCQTTYAINAVNNGQWQDEQENEKATALNVTKTINFKQCTKIADVGYGFQTEQPQPQCAQCKQYWSKNQQQSGQNGQQSAQQHPCAKCDPKKVKEQLVSQKWELFIKL
jgi:hypothetical protein